MSLNVFSLLFGFSALLVNSIKSILPVTLNTNQQVILQLFFFFTFNYNVKIVRTNIYYNSQLKLVSTSSFTNWMCRNNCCLSCESLVFLSLSLSINVFSPACWFICCKGDLHSICHTLFSGIILCTFPVLERPTTLQFSSGLQPPLTGMQVEMFVYLFVDMCG